MKYFIPTPEYPHDIVIYWRVNDHYRETMCFMKKTKSLEFGIDYPKERWDGWVRLNYCKEITKPELALII